MKGGNMEELHYCKHPWLYVLCTFAWILILVLDIYITKLSTTQNVNIMETFVITPTNQIPVSFINVWEIQHLISIILNNYAFCMRYYHENCWTVISDVSDIRNDSLDLLVVKYSLLNGSRIWYLKYFIQKL